ncbi:MAG: hypothetical protein HYZ57_04045 [Acidobacteria bacterium]|nr:hypothetical protein [Acidobacteriota bacterium]MBI3278997.1 hypothetical protein [Acidobacteriota bacterium]
MELIRGLTAEYATAKVFLPRSKKPLPIELNGSYDKKAWEEVGRELGPAARTGDLVQVTKVSLDDDRIVFEINGGIKGGRKWYERIEVGMGTRTTPIGGINNSPAPGGTTVALLFHKKLPPLESAEIKKMLAPVLDFEKRSATEHYIETLPPEIQAAVKEKRAVEGMNRDQVILALGKPRQKHREMHEGEELEDWIYGLPPGKVTFVTFHGSKVVRVKEAYAGLGGQTLPPMKPQ